MEEVWRLWGANIRRGRENLHLTQEQLAERLGVRQGTLSRWEGGRRGLRDRDKVRLAEVLDQDVAQLFPLTRRVA